MQFTRIVIGASGTFTNTSANFILIVSWGASFTINDPNSNAASGTIAAFVATNSIILIPPGWSMVAGGSQVVAQGLYVTPLELQQAVVGAGGTGVAAT